MIYRFGDCTLDTQRHQLQRAGQPVRLRSKAFQVLLYLLEHRDRTVLKRELYEAVWPQQFISESTLESTLRAVRQAIGDSGRAQQLIQTVYGYGYRVIAAVEVCTDVPPGTAGEAPQPLPGSVSAPPPDDDLHAASVPLTLESAGGDVSRCATGMSDEGEPPPQKVAAALTPGPPAVPSHVWEQKPVAVLAIELTFPTATDGEAAAYEPWTAASRWEQALVAKVQGFGGVVLQRSPSLLLVAFGIPKTLEQMPQRAVQAALALRHLVAESADQGPCPALRQVAHWGPLLVDVQARDPAAQLHAIGDTLAWPVRLLGQAAPGDILLSSEVGQLIKGWCEVQTREVSLQTGEPGRIGIYAVVGNRPQWARLELHGRRPLSRFVGRERELALLRELLPQVEGGRGQVVGMIGEPGVGKSRLCDEFIHGSLAPPWRILETQGTAYGQATPYLPIIDLLKGYFRLEDREALPTVCEKIAAKLRGLDDTLIPTAPAFLRLLDVPVDDPQWQAIEAPQRRQRTLDAMKRLLLWESQRQPLLLVVENLHWIDTETQAVLDTLIESLPAARLFLLTTYRPEYRHVWGSKTYYMQLRLDPLPRERTRELVDALLGNAAALAPLKQRLVERTQGNPFFLEERIRSLVETQVLVGGHGAYRLAQGLPSLQVPATVQAVLAARIDRLTVEEKRLLQTAAVIGAEVPFPLLQAVAERSEEGLRTGLAHLQGAEFLYETSLFPELAYTFKHTLTQEVAYESLLPERRRVLHARIVQAMEMMYADRLGEYAERLAQHALQGEVWDKALRHCQQAGAKALYRAAFRQAVACFDQALTALVHVPESPDRTTLAIDLRLGLVQALTPPGELARALMLAGEAEALARTLDDRVRLGRVLTLMTDAYRLGEDLAGALAAGQQALALADELGDRALQMTASQRLGAAYCISGDYGRAATLLRRNVEVLEPGTPDSYGYGITSRAWLAWVLSFLGEFAEGIHHGEEALRLATEAGQGFPPIVAHACLGRLYLAKGDLEQAVHVLDRGLVLCRATGTTNWARGIVASLGHAYALMGRLVEGDALLGDAIREDIRTRMISLWIGWLSEVCLLAGRLDAAWQHARQALDLARQRGERAYEALALRQLGAVLTHTDPPDVEQAENLYRQALALAEDLGMRPLGAHCHLGLGTLYAKIGRPEQARAELSTAIELYRAMDMTFWLPQAEAALAIVYSHDS